jgi:hypothetical protein
MKIKMSRKAGSRFAGKKILFSLALLAASVLPAVPALAADIAPAAATSGAAAQNQPTLVGTAPQWLTNQSVSAMPCPLIMSQGSAGNIMYRANPCGSNSNLSRSTLFYNGFGQNAVWYGLASVITLVLVWVVLLLLICVLWEVLQKHRRG